MLRKWCRRRVTLKQPLAWRQKLVGACRQFPSGCSLEIFFFSPCWGIGPGEDFWIDHGGGYFLTHAELHLAWREGKAVLRAAGTETFMTLEKAAWTSRSLGLHLWLSSLYLQVSLTAAVSGSAGLRLIFNCYFWHFQLKISEEVILSSGDEQ